MAGKGATTQKMAGGTLGTGDAVEDTPAKPAFDAEKVIRKLTKRIENLETVNDTRLRSRGLID